MSLPSACICSLKWHSISIEKQNVIEHEAHKIFIYAWLCCLVCPFLCPQLTQYGLMMLYGVSWEVSFGSVNGLSPDRHQANTSISDAFFINWTIRNTFQWLFNPNVVFQENVFENSVYKVSAILVRPGSVDIHSMMTSLNWSIRPRYWPFTECWHTNFRLVRYV